MTIGIIIICFTVPKQQDRPCQHIFKTTARSSSGYNSRPPSAAIGNLNNDSQLDIVVANSGTDTVGIFLGYNNGIFQAQKTYSTGSKSQPYSVVLGDFTDDNKLDIVALNYGTNSMGLLVGHGDGTFEDIRLYSLGTSRPVSATVADLNNDMYLDIIIANYDTSTIGILLGYGNGSFSMQVKYSTGYDSLPCYIVVADLDKDNHLDLIISNSGTNNVAIFLGHGNGSFSFSYLYSTGVDSHPVTVAVGDLNGDDRLDIVVANYGSSTVGAFLNYANGTFSKMKISVIDSIVHAHSIVIGDFNRDKILDVAVANTGNDSVVVLRGSDNGTFVSQETYSTGIGSTPVFLLVDDFNNDNELDLITVNNGTNNIAIFLRYSIKAFSNQTMYSTGYLTVPISLALGDFNNDGLLDIAVANSRGSNVGVGIFLGYNNGSFGAQTMFSMGSVSYPLSIAVGDFNNDSLLDIVVADYGTNNIDIFLGYGNGTFISQKTISTGIGSSPSAIAIGDFNNDDLLDIAVTHASTSNLGIYLGYGNWTFVGQTVYSVGHGTSFFSVAVSDFNNDTMLDIVVSNYLDDTITILCGYGNGSFDKMLTYFIGYGSRPTSLALGDFNNDNILDIAFSNAGINKIGVLFGHANGTFGMLTFYPTGDGSRPFPIMVGNFNHDMWLDIVVGNINAASVGVFLGLDNIYAANQATYSTGSGSHPCTVLVNDVNNDHLFDLIIVNSAHDNIGIRSGYGNGSFTEERTYPVEKGSRPQFVVVGDFNSDSHMDMAITNTGNDSVTVAFGNGNGIFTNQTVHSTGYGSHPSFATVGDFNNDNRLDLVILNEGTHTVGVFLSFEYATFRKHSSSSTGTNSNPEAIAAGDFNNDSLLDVVVANSNTNNIGIFLGYGNGTFAPQKTFSTESGSTPFAFVLGDFNNDSLLDVAVANSGTNYVSIFLGYGNGTFTSQKTFSTGNDSLPRSIVIGDFNNDNLLDIAVANSYKDNIGIFLGYGDGTFATQRTFSTGNSSLPYSIAVGDFNNDSLLDVAVASFRTNYVNIFLGYGNGSFISQKQLSTGSGSSPFAVAVSDFNNDRFLDIAVVNSNTSTLGIFLGYGNGTFTSQMVYSTGNGSIPRMLTISDLNNDNRLDIAVVNFGANNVGIFFGYGDGTFTEQMTFATGSGSLPIAVTIGDFNNDNRSDIVVVNRAGYNVMVLVRDGSQPFLTMKTYSTSDGSHPKSMATADFNKDYYLDIIVANTDKNNIGILMGYGNGTFMKQTTLQTGNRSQPCSVAVGDFNNDNLLDIAVANSGTNNVGIFLGYENETFSSVTTYSTGDSSIPYSIAVSDFNNDNCLDVTVANLGSTDILILFGDCHGSFGKAQSYLLGYGSQLYSVAVGDFDRDNWTDIAVANYGRDEVEVLLQPCSKT
ncbi:unnamed protein product [Rotaria sp. Silwood2]|nr:unnamed protein product [Rotaria sp. Silwood2]CAF4356348.1 unnamed protein product [Rotaria sp. Silwood2]